MTFIEMIDADDADTALRKAYESVAGARGSVANILKVSGVSPRVMLAHLELYREVQFARSELTRREREMIAVAVSVINQCHY